ncbi:hypothetical protein [Pedobacter frigoris]|uniref:Protochlamydia outer membrane protein domain-containing protein n=1 Tax=Pedobacter frigoris TaxID=2571272 RepID=A0A4U1CMP8_9SPHI|nr:hypothetical protein [Pedobacter frigoris]TKC08734.1 hypothetical protein FA047_01135 [Pedobacter frigoris]
MKTVIFSIILMCVTSAAFSQQQKFTVSLNTGLFREDFNWSIAGNMDGKNPNVLSELIWKNLEGIQYNINSSYFLSSKIALNASFTYGRISEGKVNDSDYLEDNRKQSVFDESFLSNKGYHQSANFNVLMKRDLTRKIAVTALFGYDNLVQKLYLLEDPNHPTDENLNSYYKNSWDGLQIGFDVRYSIGKVSFSGEARAGYYKYNAIANWNLVPNFKKPISFEHKANAYKYGGSLHVSYLITRQLEINSGLDCTYGASLAGRDYAYFTDERTATTKFNGAELKSSFVELGLSFNF